MVEDTLALPDIGEHIKLDESFSVKLLKLIDAKGMEDVACYKKANVSKQTWYKIQNEKNYRPGKTTVLSFAIALELTLAETEALLATAGYALSRSSKFDVIIAYFLINGNYDIYEIDQTLFQFDQPTLGALA
jgi:predicted transcriptional regulator